MKRCAILDDYQQVALQMTDWSPLADRVHVTAFQEHFADEDDLVAAIADCEIVVIMRERTPFTASLFERLPRLELLITTGVRNASIDLAAAEKHGVVVCGTAGSSTPTVELTWALILGLARDLVAETTAIRENGPWQSSVGVDLSGATLGLVGLGKIGGLVATVAQAFGMDVVAWSQNLTAERAAEVGVGLAPSLEALLERADVVSIHLRLSDRTHNLIGAPELDRMRDHAFLVNTSRGPIVDEQALLAALDGGRIAGAGLDVFDIEPLPADHVLRTHRRVLATPHLGYVSAGNYRTYFTEAVEDIEAYLAGDPVRRL